MILVRVYNMQRLTKIIRYMIIHYMYNNQHKSIVFHLFMLVTHTKNVVHEMFIKKDSRL